MVRVMTVLGVLLTIAGGQTERWVYRYNGAGNDYDWAKSLVAGADGNIYAAGYSHGSGTDDDFTVIGLTSSGAERWVYRYDGPGDSTDEANSLVVGADGNIYAAGYSCGDTGYDDFTVISLTSSGGERWVYRYNVPGNGGDMAHSIGAGADGNIYAAGWSVGSGTDRDFTVVSLTSSGGERWVYRYNGPGNYWDWAFSLVAAADGNIHAAGYSVGSGTRDDFTVISLNPTPGIAEENSQPGGNAFGLAAGTIRNRVLAYTLKLPEPATVSLSLCDLQGRRLAFWQVLAPKGTSQHTRNLSGGHDAESCPLPAGVYFLNAEVPGKGHRESAKLIVVR